MDERQRIATISNVLERGSVSNELKFINPPDAIKACYLAPGSRLDSFPSTRRFCCCVNAPAIPVRSSACPGEACLRACPEGGIRFADKDMRRRQRFAAS